MRIIHRLLVWILILSLIGEVALVPDLVAQEKGKEAPAVEETEAADQPWPREIDIGGVKVAMYQPQPELFEGNRLRIRAAVSVVPLGEKEPEFGVVWMEARVEVDREERTVAVLELKVPEARFPTAPEGKAEELAKVLETQFAGKTFTISLDRLTTSLEAAETAKKEAADLKNEPPEIVVAYEPTTLVLIQGNPELRPVENSKAMRVINTADTILLDAGTSRYYLYLGDIWMTAPDVTKGPWTKSTNTPAGIVKLTPPPQEGEEEEAEEAEEADPNLVPKVIVSTGTTELIVFDEAPKYTALPGNTLLYASNTDGDVYLDLNTQEIYLLVSGRWFKSADKKFKGPWTHVASDALPETFREIPADSDVGDVRTFVAGTAEAKDAQMDAQVPQTASISRKDNTITVEYDGDPKFEPIENSTMRYAVNTADSVMMVEEGGGVLYYCCREGVWYVSGTPKGPYTVSTKAPDDIEDVPPSSPVYNTKYVYVYSSTPETVYVGYTPGYHGCYSYGGTVVYGTGWYYRPWIGRWWWPRPVTYGWGFRYYPLGGWFSPYSVGGVVRRTRRRTRRRVRRRTYHRSRHRANNAYGRNSHRVDRKSDRMGNQLDRKTDRMGNQRDRNQGKNNVFSDKSGNVYKRDDKGNWQQRDKSGGWSSTDRAGGAGDRSTGGGKSTAGTGNRSTGSGSRSTGASSSSFNKSSMERSNSSRERGSSRTSSYNSSRSSSSGSRSSGGRSGGRSGGGGRRR